MRDSVIALHGIPPFLIAVVLSLTLSACQQPPLYEWGGYEDHMYLQLVHPDKEDVVTQSTRIAADIERIESHHHRVPPGVRAHLGYLYYMQGRVDDARAQFLAEKSAFPESTVFIDGMISRMDHKADARPVASASAQPIASASPTGESGATSPTVTATTASQQSAAVPKDAKTGKNPAVAEPKPAKPAPEASMVKKAEAAPSRTTAPKQPPAQAAPSRAPGGATNTNVRSASQATATGSTDPDKVDPSSLIPPSFEDRE